MSVEIVFGFVWTKEMMVKSKVRIRNAFKMSKEIAKQVTTTMLITIDLSDYAPKENILIFDVKDLLFEGIILKEKTFDLSLKGFDFSRYKGYSSFLL